MSKKILSALTVLAAVAVPTFAFAEEAGVKKEGNRYTATTPEITTSRGSEASIPRTDVDDLSTRSRRDMVKDPTGLSAAATLGLGLGDAYGVGFGARGGYTLPGRFYVGGIVNYHIGNTAEALGNEIRNRTWYFGPEAGYDIGVGKVILRPVVGLGLAFRNQQVTGTTVAANTTETDVRPYLAPGAQLMYPIGNFFVGGDSRVMLMSGNTTITFLGAAGVHL